MVIRPQFILTKQDET